jgi:hypothetical protein
MLSSAVAPMVHGVDVGKRGSAHYHEGGEERERTIESTLRHSISGCVAA